MADVSKSSKSNLQYEICEVKAYYVDDVGLFAHILPVLKKWVCIAEALGPNGKYKVARSPEFKSRNNDPYDLVTLKDSKALRANLASILMADGWEPQNQLLTRFRRVITH